jgi:D-alanyl-D-alanine carboxypeptidase (penicillin-binding protein 5/6)
MDEYRENRFKNVQKAVAAAFAAIFFVALFATFITSGGECAYAEKKAPASGSAAAVEVSTGRVLYQENADIKMPMASTTKILTAITVLEHVPDPSAIVIIKREAVGIEGSSIYLREGEKLTVLELLYGLMLRSGNDSAAALALFTAGSIEGFAELMNETASAAGATSSNFVNPHGLNHKDHYTTAKDLAMISAYAMKNPIFKKVVSTKRISISGEPRRYLVNKNKMLWEYEGATGIKTGFTKAAGRCLVSSAERNGMEVVSVVLNTGPMWEKSKQILDYAFSNYKLMPLYDKERMTTFAPVTGAKGKYAVLAAEKPPLYPLKSEELKRIKIEVKPFELKAPLKGGEDGGYFLVSLDNRLLYTGKLYNIGSVKRKGIADFFKKSGG